MFPRITRKRTLAAVGGVFAIAAMGACMPANGTPETIAVAGSDTTQDVMAAIVAEYNVDTDWNTDPDELDNILAQESSPNVVAADGFCGEITYHTPPGPGEVVAPNGSSSGRNALKASVLAGDGCIDIARSSSGPRTIGSDLATFEYYAYALDAVGWASASAKAPANLTHAQLQGIYNCTFTDWSQVGGTAGPIKRYWPQAGSGTRAFAQSDLVGFDPTAISGPNCPAVTLTQENTGQEIATNGDQATAVVPYSMANWIAQARGTAPDQRGGQTMRNLNGQSLIVFPGGLPTPNTAGPVAESNVKLNNPAPAYPGIRYVFNVIDSTQASYYDSRRMIGFENLTYTSENVAQASPLCDGEKVGTIENFGFGALDTTTGPNNLLGSTCRLYTP